MLYTSDFDYNLPSKLIAQQPVKPRDHSRLLILDKKTGKVEYKHFYDIIDYLKPGDVLVLNNSKVFPARLIGRKKDTSGKIEIFLLKQQISKDEKKNKGEIWDCLIGGHGRKENLVVNFYVSNQSKSILTATVKKENKDGIWEVSFNQSEQKFINIINRIGRTPLPPYIKRNKDAATLIAKDKITYQTIYADENKVGSVAAPTAGLHFTSALLNKLKERGVQVKYITLHVGLGTFAPVKTEKIEGHKMHSELVEISKETLKDIKKAKKEKRRIIAVGTTSARALESVFSNNETSKYKFETNIFIYPPYRFKVIDAMITNFHLPKSTLLMLISAFAGKKNIDKAYQLAIKNEYRFYSYGDAMLIN